MTRRVPSVDKIKHNVMDNTDDKLVKLLSKNGKLKNGSNDVNMRSGFVRKSSKYLD